MMNEVPVQPTVAIGEGVDEYESERDSRSRRYGRITALCQVTVHIEEADHEVGQVFRAGGEVIRYRLTRFPVVTADEAAGGPVAGRDKPVVRDDDLLKAHELILGSLLPAGLAARPSPACGARQWRALLFDSERGLRILEHQEGAGTSQYVRMQGIQSLCGLLVKLFRHEIIQCLRPVHERAECRSSGEVVPDAVAGRRNGPGGGILDLVVDQRYVILDGEVGYGEPVAGQPFKQEPEPAAIDAGGFDRHECRRFFGTEGREE